MSQNMKGLGPQGYTRGLFSTLALGQVILMLRVLRVCGAVDVWELQKGNLG